MKRNIQSRKTRDMENITRTVADARPIHAFNISRMKTVRQTPASSTWRSLFPTRLRCVYQASSAQIHANTLVVLSEADALRCSHMTEPRPHATESLHLSGDDHDLGALRGLHHGKRWTFPRVAPRQLYPRPRHLELAGHVHLQSAGHAEQEPTQVTFPLVSIRLQPVERLHLQKTQSSQHGPCTNLLNLRMQPTRDAFPLHFEAAPEWDRSLVFESQKREVFDRTHTKSK